jgi:Ran GTPase-activating protein (RanGAP) involved in mRNA processing and transport
VHVWVRISQSILVILKNNLFKLAQGTFTETTLELWGNYIGKNDAIAIAKALEKNTTITKLDFSNNNIGKDGAKELTDMLKVNNTITTLNFAYNNIGKDGAKALADALKVNNTITELDLFRNNIGIDGAKALAAMLKKNKTIKELDLSGNYIGNNGAKELTDTLKKNKTITKLYLQYNNIGDAGVIVLGRACAGKEIEVEFNDDEKNDLFKKAQGTFEGEKLDLSNNNIGIEGAIAIAGMLEKNKTIKELNLACAGKEIEVDFDNTQKNDLFKLAQGTFEGEKLDLSNNNIGIEGAKAIAGMLEKNETITELNLACAGKEIEVEFNDDEKNDLFKLAQGTFKEITLLLRDNNIRDTGAKALADALKENKTITELNLACAGKEIEVEFNDDEKNDLFKKAQ